jgi:hypothetical protein
MFTPPLTGQAAIPNVVTPEPNQRFAAIVREADQVVIRTGGNCHRQISEEKIVFESKNCADVARVTQLFALSGEYTNAHSSKWEGQEVLMITNCLCCGTHTFSFRKTGKEILSISIHHRSHARALGE